MGNRNAVGWLVGPFAYVFGLVRAGGEVDSDAPGRWQGKFTVCLGCRQCPRCALYFSVVDRSCCDFVAEIVRIPTLQSYWVPEAPPIADSALHRYTSYSSFWPGDWIRVKG